jgi:twitching motility protein PilT
MDLLQLLTSIVDHKASDLHLTAEAPPLMRLNGELTPLAESAMGLDACRNMILGVLTESQRARLEQEWELDFALQVEGGAFSRKRTHIAAGPWKPPFAIFLITFRNSPEWAMGPRPPDLRAAAWTRPGHGMTGSGKSTTLAAMVKRISQPRRGDHHD